MTQKFQLSPVYRKVFFAALGFRLVYYMNTDSLKLCKILEMQFKVHLLCSQVKSFFGSLTEEAGSEMRCIRQAYETIEDNIRWMDKNLPLLQAWLDKHRHRPLHDDL